MQKKLIESLASLFNIFPDPVLFVRGNRLEYYNSAAQELFSETGYDPKQSGNINPLLESLFPPSSDPASPAVASSCLINGRHYHIAVSGLQDLRIYLFRSSADPSLASGSPPHSVIAARLRGPVSTLISASNLLSPLVSELENPKGLQYLSIMNQCYYRILRMIGNITDLDGIANNGSFSLSLENIDVVEFCRQLSFSVAPLAEVAGIQFRFEPQLPSVVISVDSQKLERLLLNLISNALKYTASGGTIVLRLSASKASVFFSVSDNGSGISPDLLPSVFTRFMHPNYADALSTGLGLGLPLVRQIAEKHGGSVVLESREGKGTTVTVSLPNRRSDSTVLRSSLSVYDYTGGFPHVMVELSDALPFTAFSPLDLE
ncbi:sensor histidine kinase [Papillibacter cinnamivorans]|uniref:histidine kinase n=1 Tax=Papillibacter cinnamivorans DSM 12816 TaxID=1122930 RepID=A0A1W2D175_9FIRM|nr:HAMP domain-containing sensor histidine kinase [Papillibacter cinnamivorans]SMC90812.1 Histidine kinase-, DNA gyrase B-, and HSP90-like ATPase [Papillibacter cinnamivorans DSM 12816]